MSDFRLANDRELNTTTVEALNQLCFRESSSWRIHTTSVNKNWKRKTLVVQWPNTVFIWSQKYVSLARKEKATLCQMEHVSKLVTFRGSFLRVANSMEIFHSWKYRYWCSGYCKNITKTCNYILSSWKADEE